MSKNLISLSGYAGAGKDTVGKILVEDHGYTRVAFADGVKDMAAALADYLCEDIYSLVEQSWAERKAYGPWIEAEDFDRTKGDPVVREFLQVLGTEAVRDIIHPDAWIMAAERKIERIDGPVVITDARFPNEIHWVQDRCGECWRVDRPGTEPANNHASEHAWVGEDFDAVFPNVGTVSDLRDLVFQAVKFGAVIGSDYR